MAILEKETNNYFKIEFDECMVKGSDVYVMYSTYLTSADRDKEKERRPKLSAFLNNVQQRITELNEELLSAAAEMGKTPEELVGADGMIPDAYPDLKAKQEELLALSDIPTAVYDRFYVRGDEQHTEIKYSVSKEVLTGYGFEETWITDPIRLNVQAVVHCGEYYGETINQEFYYNRLKQRMSENIIDC